MILSLKVLVQKQRLPPPPALHPLVLLPRHSVPPQHLFCLVILLLLWAAGHLKLSLPGVIVLGSIFTDRTSLPPVTLDSPPASESTSLQRKRNLRSRYFPMRSCSTLLAVATRPQSCAWALSAVDGDSLFAIQQFGARCVCRLGQGIVLPRLRLQMSGVGGSRCCSRGRA